MGDSAYGAEALALHTVMYCLKIMCPYYTLMLVDKMYFDGKLSSETNCLLAI